MTYLFGFRRDRHEVVFLIQERARCICVTVIECQRLPPSVLVRSYRAAVGGAIMGVGLPPRYKCASVFSVTSKVQPNNWRVSIGHGIQKESANENSAEHQTE